MSRHANEMQRILKAIEDNEGKHRIEREDLEREVFALRDLVKELKAANANLRKGEQAKLKQTLRQSWLERTSKAIEDLSFVAPEMREYRRQRVIERIVIDIERGAHHE